MKKIKDFFWIAFLIFLFGYIIYEISMNSFTSHFLGDNPQKIEAVIIDEKNFKGNQRVDPKFSYSYQFVINGQKYTGNAHDNSLKVGDSVYIEFNKDHPGINKPLNPKE